MQSGEETKEKKSKNSFEIKTTDTGKKQVQIF